MRRYRLVCVADGVPSLGSFDDLDEAIVNCQINFDVWDSEADEWLTPTCQAEVDEAWKRLKAKRAATGASR